MIVAGWRGDRCLQRRRVGYLRMIPFVVTLAMMTITNGAAVWLTGSISIANIPHSFVDLFFARYLGLPISVIIAAVVALAAIRLMSRTAYGRRTPS